VVVTLGVPAGERMAVLEHAFREGTARRLKGAVAGGSLVLTRKPSGGDTRFTLKGKGLDLAALDTGNRDFTLAIEVGKLGDFASAQFVQNRVLTGKKNVFKLPKKRRKA
jgi:hypothetical protein